MGLIVGDDGLPADEVGIWAKDKHKYLTRYLDISRATRRKYIGERKGGAVYFDLFCGTGRSKVRDTGEWIDGGVVAAWRTSVEEAPLHCPPYLGFRRRTAEGLHQSPKSTRSSSASDTR